MLGCGKTMMSQRSLAGEENIQNDGHRRFAAPELAPAP
jgi:hypothetical protein